MKNIVSFVWLLAFLLCGCSKEDQLQKEPSAAGGRVFTTSFEGGESRVYVEGGTSLRWTKQDRVSLFDGSTLNREYVFGGETGDASGSFHMASKPDGTGSSLSANYAVYPYSPSMTMAADGTITLTLPYEQRYAENSFGLGANTMVAVTEDKDDTSLQFKNVGTCLKVQLYGDDVTVKSITLMGKNGEKIAGNATVTAAYNQAPVVSMADDAVSFITLDCGTEGVTLGTSAGEPTVFWLVIPPVTFTEGFTLTVEDLAGKVFTYTVAGEVEFERNVVRKTKAVEVVAEEKQTTLYYSTDTEELEGWSEGLFSSDGNYYLAKPASNNGCHVTIGNLFNDDNLIFYVDEEKNVREIYSDNNVFAFNNYTENSVDVSFFDENGNTVTETIVRGSTLSRGMDEGQQAASINLGLNCYALKEAYSDIIANESTYKFAKGWYSKALNTFNGLGNALKLGGASEIALFDNKVVDAINTLDNCISLGEMGYELWNSMKNKVKPSNPAAFAITAWAGFYATYLELYDEHIKAYFGNNKAEIGNVVFDNEVLNVDVNILDCEHWYDVECGVIVQENSSPEPRYSNGLETKEVTRDGEYIFVQEDTQKDNVYYCRPFLITKDKASLWKWFLADLAGPLVRYGETVRYVSPMREALEELYKSTNGKNWECNDNWCSDKPLTEWYGVTKTADGYEIDLSGNGLTGKIEQTFPADEKIKLNVHFNQLSSIKLSGCSALTNLVCWNNNLTSLDVSGCVNLNELKCSENQLVSLNVSGCSELTFLNCSDNQLADLVVSECQDLVDLDCSGNQLATLDVSKCTGLWFLNCADNLLKKVDTSQCLNLISLDVSKCKSMESLDVSRSRSLRSLDVSHCTAMNSLNASRCTSLDTLGISVCSPATVNVSDCISLASFRVATGMFDVNVSGCTNLKSLTAEVATTLFYTLNASGCTALKSLKFEATSLVTLNVSGCTALTTLECSVNNNLSTLDVSGCTKLTTLRCSSNRLTSLDVSTCMELTTLRCSQNRLSSLDVTGCKYLTALECGSNKLTSLDVSTCTGLTTLKCTGNQLTSLDVSNCKALKNLDCYINQLTSLDVSDCTALTTLDCRENRLTSLDVSDSKALTTLDCRENQLTSLNSSNCTALTTLNCRENQLTSLNSSNCTALTTLYCDDNQLTSLNVDGCKVLSELICYNNKIKSVIPDWFSQLSRFVHDVRYTYKKVWSDIEEDYIIHYTDHGKGWWYPGEPERGYHD